MIWDIILEFFISLLRIDVMLNPSHEEFSKRSKNDSNISRLRSALRTYPDLIRIRDDVRCTPFVDLFFHSFLVRYLFTLVILKMFLFDLL